MKTNLLLLLTIALPVCLQAQPNIGAAEFYNIGDVIETQNANLDGLTAGTSGANQTWNFTVLSAQGSPTSFTVQSNSGSATFPTADIVEVFSDNSRQYINENNAESYLIGIEDSATGDTVNYNNGMLIEQRPFTYLSSYVDSYNVVTATVHGTGIITVTGDGYGTLFLPSGTDSNVLRIKRVAEETDTSYTNPGVISSSSTITYLWFDNTNTAPLLRIDSVTSTTNVFSVTVQYLANPLSVKTVAENTAPFNAAINDNTIVINGGFEQNKPYAIAVYDIAGQNIFTSSFTASGSKMQFDTNRQLSAGIYLVRLTGMDDASGNNVIKVVKR